MLLFALGRFFPALCAPVTEEIPCQARHHDAWLLLMDVLVQDSESAWESAGAGMHPAAIPWRPHLAVIPPLQLALPLESH